MAIFFAWLPTPERFLPVGLEWCVDGGRQLLRLQAAFICGPHTARARRAEAHDDADTPSAFCSIYFESQPAGH